MSENDKHGQLTFDFGGLGDDHENETPETAEELFADSENEELDGLDPDIQDGWEEDFKEENDDDRTAVEYLNSSDAPAIVRETENTSSQSFISEEHSSPASSPADVPTETPIDVQPEIPEEKTAVKKPEGISQSDARRAALAFLASLKPTGFAVKVPTRIKRFCADAAAFWSKPGKNGILKVSRTAIVETRIERGACWDSSNKEELIQALRSEKSEKMRLEADIRRTEPELKDNDVLFDEIQKWNYLNSTNKAYHKCLRHIDELEYAIYHGTRFERMRSAKSANELYLAVPENAIHPEEVADAWGLLYIGSDLSVKLVKEPESLPCSEENMSHLAQNIASAAAENVLFAHGLAEAKDGAMKFLPLPRRRHPKQS